MHKPFVLLPGDDLGRKAGAQAVQVLHAMPNRFGETFTTEAAHMGGAAIDAAGDPLPQATIDACKKADAILLGAVGGPKWDNAPRRPEAGLLGIRQQLNLCANLRPATVYQELASLSCPQAFSGGKLHRHPGRARTHRGRVFRQTGRGRSA